MDGLPGQSRGLGRFCFVALESQSPLGSSKHGANEKEDRLTLGSATPRDCTRMTLCRNLTAANCTPGGASGAHMSSMIRLLARESVSHCGRSFLLVHSRRKISGYTPANVCTAILTVQALSSFKRPA